MADSAPFGFGKFVPGFDFLQNIAKGASQALPQMPQLSNWIAPTLNVEELEKRIGELKAVQFWLEQNSRALSATIQALEVQKMTLATLKGMNFSMGDMANSMKLKATDTMLGGVQKMSETAAGAANAMSGAASGAAAKTKAARKKTAAKSSAQTGAEAAAANGVVDPLQWWGALTQQFQQIAGNAMKDAASQTAMDTARNMATGVAREAMKSAGSVAKAAAKSAAGKSARKRAAKK
jgi:hypothetical protein